MGNYILSGFTDEYADDFGSQLLGAEKLGLTHIELRGADGVNVAQMTVQQVKDYAARLQNQNLSVSAIGSPLGKISLDGNLQEHMETAKKIFEFAGILNTRNIRMFSYYLPENATPDGCKSRVYDAMGMLLDAASAYDVVLCHENEARIYGDIPERCLDLMQQFPQLRCVFDMGNFVLENEDPYRAYQMLKPYIAYFHVKDALYSGSVVPPGEGEAQIQRILSKHLSGVLSPLMITLEPHLQDFAGLNAMAGKSFETPYAYPDQQTAFMDAANRFKELMKW